MNRRLSSSLAHGLNPHLRRPRNSPNQFPVSGPDRPCLGPQIHTVTTKTRFASSDVGVRYALLSIRGNCGSGSSESVRHLFESMPQKDLMSWNLIISSHSRGADFVSAFGYFSEMRRAFDLWPDEFTFGSLIALTHASPCPVGIHLLEQLLACVAKSGFLENVYVGSASVSAFLRFGLVDEAMEIFRGLGDRNSVSMNELMVGLVRIGRADEAVEVFRVAKDSVEANCDSYVVLLSACAVFAVPEAGRRVGREVHGGVIRTGMIDHTVAIKNGLINMYAKCGAIDDARKVFDSMGSKDSVSWNSMISGLDRNGLCEEAITRFRDMWRSGNVCSNFTLISTLSSCAGSKHVRFGALVHCEAIKLGLDADVSVLNSLLAMYSKCGFVSDCRKVFSSMRVYDTISWNSMIGALADSECSISESIETFLEMTRAGWAANRVTFLHLLTALASLSTTELLRQAHSLVIKYGYGADHNIKNALLSCYAKCGEVNECERIFTWMSRQRDIVSWNAMVSAYTHNGLVREAMDLICSMMRDGLKMDPFTLATLVSTCASIASLERGMEIHAHLVRACTRPNVVVESALLDMYSKCGRIDYASRVFKRMAWKNKFSWNSMIAGYARHGLCEEALELFEEMRMRGDRQPDLVTFVAILSACSHAGLVDRGLKHFKSMTRDHRLVPRMEHYSCVVDLLGRAGRLKEVEDFIRDMPIEPNVLVWRTVVCSFIRAKAGNAGFAAEASEKLFELEPENAVNYVLASNMHASRGSWEGMERARARMSDARAVKEAGRSWVTMRDGVHVFRAGDRSHPEVAGIYAKLGELYAKMREMGYVPRAEFALYDVDAENKEEMLRCHSERLAVAFVLARAPGARAPIRIMKNLRVCGDCHVAFGYVSEIVGRQIVLRDANRFHHFEGGKCSCGDYW
ncbi:putative pentatricopeptide repeat-containing protein [Acorus calamus]|uniref:Pentatricopeptide repeat-containing protein n=1 Tax=Acorus calamus TaxID=4465 RepID=A0AAV9D8S0_ACOCL|nr:putative pentatricopeptide repeat-containing protein [Acorus calamus]